MTIVIKRSGKKQLFHASKIRHSVQKSCREAGLSASRTKELIIKVANPAIEKFSKMRSITTSKIRKSLLGRLDTHSKSASAAWRRYDKTRR